VVLVFLGSGLHHGIDTHEAWVEALDDALDRATLAGRVGAFHNDDDGLLFLPQGELHIQQFELVLLELLFVLVLVEGFVVELVEDDAVLGHRVWWANSGNLCGCHARITQVNSMIWL